MSVDKPQKINIGFLGGQSLGAKISGGELSKLRAALPAGGWHDLVAEDGMIALDLSKVVYVLADHESSRVGFGS
jgi:hypothetical protein